MALKDRKAKLVAAAESWLNFAEFFQLQRNSPHLRLHSVLILALVATGEDLENAFELVALSAGKT